MYDKYENVTKDSREENVEHLPQEPVIPQRGLGHLTHGPQQTRLAVHAEPVLRPGTDHTRTRK